MRVLVVTLAAVLGVPALCGCDRLAEVTGGASSATPTSNAAPAGTAGSGGPFAGKYRSNWGFTTFAQQGAQVTAGYENGSMTCTATQSVLDCDWREAAAFGKAKLIKLPDGNIEGTWGKGASATDGGRWSFVLESALPTGGPPASFAGKYDSAWGVTTFTQEGTRVTGKYPKGNLSCSAAGNTLECDWREATTLGKARLIKQANGKLSGTWGDGDSATNGGPWVFTPR
jgi:hypothetical protein